MVGSLLNITNDPFAKMDPDQSLVDFTHFDGTKAFDTMGFADSEGAVSGRAGTQEVDGDKLDKLELQREKREKRDKTNELIELGFSLREARVANVGYSNGQFHMFGKAIDEEDMDAQIDETLQNIDSVADKHNLGGQEKTELTTLLMAYQQADTPQEKVEILEKIAEKQPDIAYEIAEDAASKSERRNQAELSAKEEASALVADIDDRAQFRVIAQETVAEVEVDRAELARTGVSPSDNPFANVSNASSQFQIAASGSNVVDNQPSSLPDPQAKVPGLTNG